MQTYTSYKEKTWKTKYYHGIKQILGVHVKFKSSKFESDTRVQYSL